jgi:hypothetical protein
MVDCPDLALKLPKEITKQNVIHHVSPGFQRFYKFGVSLCAVVKKWWGMVIHLIKLASL